MPPPGEFDTVDDFVIQGALGLRISLAPRVLIVLFHNIDLEDFVAAKKHYAVHHSSRTLANRQHEKLTTTDEKRSMPFDHRLFGDDVARHSTAQLQM
jgi:hypothetical protein